MAGTEGSMIENIVVMVLLGVAFIWVLVTPGGKR